MSSRAPDSDASFVSGLILGVLVGAALVLVLSPEFQTRISTTLQDLGIGVDPAGQAEQQRDRLLSAVAPPPDPLGGTVS